MIHYIKGKLTTKFDGGVIIENNGIGYEIYTPGNSTIYLQKDNENAMVYTRMIVKEDDLSLYGFPDQESVSLFNKLLTVSGVGAKGALALIGSMPLNDLKRAIAYEDAPTLTRANGIGKKTAQRICIDLKDKLGSISENAEAILSGMIGKDEKAEAISGLIALGYSRSEAVDALSSIKDEDLTTEQFIKKALKNLF